MGVKGLWALLDSTGRPVDLESLKGKVLAVDVSIWMNQAVRGVRDRHGNPIKAAHLVTLFHRVCKLLFYGVKPVFVFDGSAPLLKKKTLARIFVIVTQYDGSDARRQRKGDAERDSTRAAERLMKVLLKKRAVGAVLGKESTVRAVRGAVDRTTDDDLFKLPSLPQLPRSSSSEEEEEEVDDVGRADPAAWRHHLQFEENPASVDVDSSDFKALPCEIQHELLTDLREAHKRRRTLFQAMPEESVSFSNYQLAGLLQRSRLSRRIEGLQEEMSGSARAQGHEGLAALGPGQHVESQRVVSEESSHYILVQGPMEHEGSSTGAASASAGVSGTSGRPRHAGGHSAWSPAPERADEPSPAMGAEVTEVKASPAAEGAAAVEEIPSHGAVAVAMGPGPEAVAVAKRLSDEAVVRERLGEEAVVVKELGEDAVVMERRLGAEVVVMKEHPDQKVVAMVTEEIAMESSPEKKSVAVEMNPGDAFARVKSLDAKPVTIVIVEDEEVVVKHSSPGNQVVATKKQPSEDGNALENNLPEDSVTTHKGMDAKSVSIVTNEEVVVMERSFGDRTVVAENISKHRAVTMDNSITKAGAAVEEELDEEAVVVKTTVDGRAVVVVESLAVDAVTAEAGTTGSAGGRNAPPAGGGGVEVVAGNRGVVGHHGSRSPAAPGSPSPDGDGVGVTSDGAIAASSSGDEDEDFVEVSSVSDIGFEREEETEEEGGGDRDEDKWEDTDGAAGTSLAETGGPSRCDPVTPGERSPSPGLPAQPPDWAFSPMTQEDLENLQYDLSEEEQLLVSERGHQERMATTITEQMCFECQELLRMFGVPYMTAPGEAEAQCAALDLADRTHGTITDDSDIWLFGGRYVYKNFFNQNRHIDFYQLVDIQRHIGLDRTKLVNLAYLMGSDYTDGVAGVGGVTALEVLNEFSGASIEPLVTLRAWWDEAQRSRKLHARPVESKLKRKLRQLTLPEGFPNPAVERAYLEPATSAVAGTFSWGQPQLLSIAEFCQSRFGWEVKKTEELLRPVLKQLSATQSQSRIDSFFPVVHPEVRNIKSKRLMRAVASIKRQEGQAAAEVAGPEPEPAPMLRGRAGGGFVGSTADSDAAHSNGSVDALGSGSKRKHGGGACETGETSGGDCPAGKAVAPKRAKRKPLIRDSSTSSSSSGDEASCDFITSGRTVTAQSVFRGRGPAARGGRRARAARRR